MKRSWTDSVRPESPGPIRLQGWLHHYRQLARVGFLLIRDAAGIAQIVTDDHALMQKLAALPHEAVLEIEGEVAVQTQAPRGAEVRLRQLSVIAANGDPPLELYRPVMREQLSAKLDHAALSLRHPRRRGTARLAALATEGFRRHLQSQRFVEVHTPKIVGTATEGGANVFRLDYFGRDAFLAQSPQFYKQIMVGALERVFEVGPVFRAEPHDTPRHLNEYTSLDVEMGFIESHRDVMAVLGSVMSEILAAMSTFEADSQFVGNWPTVPNQIPIVHFEDVRRRFGGLEPDLSPAEERQLGTWALDKYNSAFLFVEGYPLAKRPFYTHADPDRPGYSRGFDLIFKGTELVTGGQRLHRYKDYVVALQERQLAVDSFSGYLEAFKYGMPPHGGFAIGLERLLWRLLDLPNIREASLFPRDMTRLEP